MQSRSADVQQFATCFSHWLGALVVASIEHACVFYQLSVSNLAVGIVLASLYIGSGAMETSLLEAVAAACKRRPALRATLLVDALRAQRVEKPTKISRCASAPKP